MRRRAARARFGDKLRTCSFDYMQAERCIFVGPTRSETMAERKTRVAILFGGRSAEHDVSRASAANVLRSLDPDRYDVTLIGIARDGRWLLADAGNGAGTGATALDIPENGPQLSLLPGGQGRALILDGNAAT